jgi:hypothetical protein
MDHPGISQEILLLPAAIAAIGGSAAGTFLSESPGRPQAVVKSPKDSGKNDVYPGKGLCLLKVARN